MTPPRPGAPLPPHPALEGYYRDEPDRRRRLGDWFDRFAPVYDRASRMVGFGQGDLYRRDALLRAGLRPGMRVLDVACGTGLVGAHAARIAGAAGLAVGLDPSAGMLASAFPRRLPHVVRGVAESIPFADGAFDFLCMGYALRHVADLRRTFGEYRRVLRPGGTALLLEITPPASRPARALLRLYLGRLLPLAVRVCGGGRSGETVMRYHWETIARCVPPETILSALRDAGFAAAARRVILGIFSEYTARRG